MMNTLRFLFPRLFFTMILAYVSISVFFHLRQLIEALNTFRSVTIGTTLAVIVAVIVIDVFLGMVMGLAALVLMSFVLLIRWVFHLSLSQRMWEWGLPLIATLVFSIYPALEILQETRSPPGMAFHAFQRTVAMSIIFYLVCVRTMRAYYRERLYPRKLTRVTVTYSRYGELT